MGCPSGADNRLFVDAWLWLAWTAASWRDLSSAFGKFRAAQARVGRPAMVGGVPFQ
ncbi:hypothetical protein B5V46_13810 [Rhodovulum sp. MB263]|nr:hypothetical protein B5V46_13810 [Rhodovulum sp. MB263]